MGRCHWMSKTVPWTLVSPLHILPLVSFSQATAPFPASQEVPHPPIRLAGIRKRKVWQALLIPPPFSGPLPHYLHHLSPPRHTLSMRRILIPEVKYTALTIVLWPTQFHATWHQNSLVLVLPPSGSSPSLQHEEPARPDHLR